MTADEYLSSVLQKYLPQTGPTSPVERVGLSLYYLISNWVAPPSLLGVTYSGSYAKGTAVRGNTDVDLFVSLSPSISATLKQLYWSLFSYLSDRGLIPCAQNVSIRIQYLDLSVDLVPAKKQAGNTTDHSLYRRKADTWTQTNVQQHISLVQNCGRRDEIRLLKIWRQLHGLGFPSFYLELITIRALAGRGYGRLADNVWAALGYIAGNLLTDRIVDPANANNIISDDMTDEEKRKVVAQAKLSLQKRDWGQIIW